jgi:nucleoid-associated protein YgaU
VFDAEDGRLVIWDFDAWNGLVVAHEVKQDETLSKIAQKVWGDGNLYPKAYEQNRGKIGPNQDKIRPGMILYFWKKKG